MFATGSAATPERIGFLLIPNFSMIAFTASVEPLRIANRLSGNDLYEWRTLSADSGPVRASNGVMVTPDAGLEFPRPGEVFVVCAGINAEKFHDERVTAWLRRIARPEATLGAVCTGSLLLARTGLLNGYRCTIHWENIESFVEEFPTLDIMATLFEVDRNRFTCSGGTAPIDMMLFAIAGYHGQALALAVAEEMMHSVVRHPYNPQRMDLRHRTGISNPKLLAAIGQMEAFLEAPVPLAGLAVNAGTSKRHLERLFKTHCGMTPSRYYLELRLQRAQLLLQKTSMPVLQIAAACGFVSGSHFARCYRAYNGRSPRSERSGGTAPAGIAAGATAGAAAETAGTGIAGKT